MATKDNNNEERLKILIVDDNEALRISLAAALEVNRFAVTIAASVSDALHLIDGQPFDVLLCDLHMPGAGDGFTVVSAMRHKNPDAVTLVFTGYPALKEAMAAILLQADQVLVKPMAIPELVGLIRERAQHRDARKLTSTERVASILERDASATISDWLDRVSRETELTQVAITAEERTGHLPALFRELVERLRTPRALGTKQRSNPAEEHGKIRQSQGYSIAMIVDESRILQVSIFQTLQNNLATVDFSLLLIDVMTIADEVDSQLKQTIVSFSEQTARAGV
jgi:DNA-binding response OmpR family regulator